MKHLKANAFQVQHQTWEELHIFFHPDYTVGPGVSPGQPLSRVADYTASGESHPALKTSLSICLWPYYNRHIGKFKCYFVELSFYFFLTSRAG